MSQTPKDEVCVSGSFCILFICFVYRQILSLVRNYPRLAGQWAPDNCHTYLTPTLGITSKWPSCLFFILCGSKVILILLWQNTSPTGASSPVLSLLSFTQWSNHVAVSVSSNPLPEAMWSLSVSAVIGHKASEKLLDVSQALDFLPANTKAERPLWRHGEGRHRLWLWRCFLNR